MQTDFLWQNLGPIIQQGLQDDQVVEIELNPDGKIWFVTKGVGHVYQGKLGYDDAMAFIHAFAQHENEYLTDASPFLDGTLPFNGERVNINIPPMCDGPSFNFRKKAKIVYSLADNVSSQVVTQAQADYLTAAIKARKNILVSGSPGSGKTTFVNALLDTLAQIAEPGHRVLVLEQLPELQCNVDNVKHLYETATVSMNRLLWIAMRNSPHRILVGEVRDAAALDLLKAWNTGCPGGMATIHANNPKAAIQRVLDLSCEAISTPPNTLAAEALDVIVQLTADANSPAGRRVTEMIEVTGFANNGFQTNVINNEEIST